MNISNDTEEILKFLDYTSGNTLRKRNDLGVILETGARYGEDILISDLIFNGKYLKNLTQSIRKNPSAEGADNLRTELEKTATLLIEQLKTIIDMCEDVAVQTRFATQYFQNTAGAFRNLTDLANDLAELKELQNTMKNKSQS